MNFGFTSVAAPKAASSSVSRYSRSTRSVLRVEPFGWPVVDRRCVLFVGVGADQAGIDGKAFTTDQTFGNAELDDALEQLPDQIDLAKAAMPVLGQSRMVWNGIRQIEAAKPTVRQVEMHLGSGKGIVVPTSCRSIRSRN